MSGRYAPDKQLLIEAMARHLPPSATDLRLLDINGETGSVLRKLRPDLKVTSVPGQANQWPEFALGSFDAVVALDYILNAPFLERALALMRPGGRLIIVQSRGQVSEVPGQKLETFGYVRILVEPALITEQAVAGVLIRGEKSHVIQDTLARIQQIAALDVDTLDLESYSGRFVHLLVQQTPNLPPWKRLPDVTITWHALALAGADRPVLLAFSSLPKAVAFMQPAVLAGKVKDINKVVKFRREVAAAWPLPVYINPELSILEGGVMTLVAIDPKTAEAPDE